MPDSALNAGKTMSERKGKDVSSLMNDKCAFNFFPFLSNYFCIRVYPCILCLVFLVTSSLGLENLEIP